MGRSRTINFDRIFFHRHHYGVMLSVIFLILLVGLAMLYQYQRPLKQLNEQADKPKSNSASALTTTTIAYSEICSKFPAVTREVSCEEAVATALKVAYGTVQNISIAPTRVRSSKGTANLWLVDIKLATPYFDSRLQKEIIILQVGIGVNESVGIYKKPLETR